MFMLIIWLQGIWLPEHGYSFTETPLWAGIYMLPLTLGLLIAGPISGFLSDRFGARPFATGGMLGGGAQLRPADAAADRLRLLGLRPDPLPHRRLDGDVRLAQPGGGDEQPAGRRPRRRRRHEPDLPELGPGALGRDLLHAADRRPRLEPAGGDERRPAGARRLGRASPTRSARRRRSRSSSPPSSATTRSSTWSGPKRCGAAGPRPRGADRADLLPAPDLGAVQRTASHTAFIFAIVACLVAAAASCCGAAATTTPRSRPEGASRRGQIPKLEEQHAR